MKLEDLTTIDQLVAFLSGTQAVAFSVIGDNQAADQLQRPARNASKPFMDGL
ncbi:MAG: hypothetical protein LJE91_02195 [Gammaproteobacteria bacterium]|nr:hypothetical protein [Gammaproteobacteria bacterium]